MADETIEIEVQAETEEAERKFKRTGSSLTAMGKSGAAAMAAIAAGAAAALASVKKLADDITGYVDNVNTLAKASGLANETIAGLSRVAATTGKSLNDLVPKDLAKKMIEAERGASEAVNAFKELGISQAEVASLGGDVDKTFRLVIDRLNGMENRGRAAAVANQLLGEAGSQMLSAFADGSKTLDDHVKQVSILAVDVGPEAVEQTARWQKATADLNLSLENTKRVLQDSGFIDLAAKGMTALAYSVLTANTVLDGMIFKFQSLVRASRSILNRDFADAFDALGEAIVGNGVQGAADLQERFAALNAEAQSMSVAAEIQGELAPVRKEIKATKESVEELDISMKALGGTFQTFTGAGLAVNAAAQMAATQMGTMQQAADVLQFQMMDLAMTTTLNAGQAMADAEQVAAAEIEAGEQRKAAAASVAQQSAAFATQLTGAVLDNINTRTREGRKAYRVMFAINKAAAIGQATVNTALGFTQALGAGPPPLNFILAGITAAMGAAQIGIIAAEQPQFHIGMRASDRAPDEFSATLRDTEKVMTAMGDETATATATANMNAGIGNGGGVSYVVVDHAAAGKIVETQLRPGSGLHRAIRRNEPVGHVRKRHT